MPIVCGVQFRSRGKTYFFSPNRVRDLAKGDYVIVATSRGDELGQVRQAHREVLASEIVGDLKPVLRRARTVDLLEAERHRENEGAAIAKCREHVERYRLQMKIVDAEYSYDGTRLTFSFTAEKRVDFRELVRDLARAYRTRIELRQIGVRDECKLMGGLGKCGRSLCCATWLNNFSPVSIRMAKAQDLPLSPMEISGLCGRLLCCLRYEDEYYRQVKRRLPRAGKAIETPLGPGKVVRVSALKETITVSVEGGTRFEVTSDQIEGNRVVEVDQSPLASTQRQALDAVLPPASEAPTGGKRRGGPTPERGEPGDDGSSQRRSRSRSRRRPRRQAPSPETQSGPGSRSGGSPRDDPKRSPRRSSGPQKGRRAEQPGEETTTGRPPKRRRPRSRRRRPRRPTE